MPETSEACQWRSLGKQGFRKVRAHCKSLIASALAYRLRCNVGREEFQPEI